MPLDELSEDFESKEDSGQLGRTQVPVSKELVDEVKQKFGFDTNAEAGYALDVALAESLGHDDLEDYEQALKEQNEDE